MLAQRGEVGDLPRLRERGYVFDLKVDGVRALVTCDPDQLTLLSRNDKQFAGRFPELLEPLERLRERSVVLDAEIAVPDRRGLPSWPLTQRRTARQSGAGRVEPHLRARLYVFDVLRLDGTDITTRTFAERRTMLEELAADWPGELVLTVCSGDPQRLWDLVVEHRLEGVIAKRSTGRYRPGRSPDWIKVKAVHTVTCLVGGVTWAGAEGTSEPRSLDHTRVSPVTASRTLAVQRLRAPVQVAAKRQASPSRRPFRKAQDTSPAHAPW